MNVVVAIIVLLKSVCTLSNAQEYFNISRGSQGSADVFQLPASMCGESKGTTECPLMGGRKIGECRCACNMKDGRGVLWKSTFGFYDGEWICQNNTALRKNTGCLTVQYRGTLNDPIPTLDLSLKRFWFLGRKIGYYELGFWRKFINSTYQGCDGTWKRLDKYHMDRNFRLRIYRFIVSLTYYPPQHGLPSGRLFKLVFTASYKNNTLPCFLLKTKGNVNCPVPYVATTSPPSTLATTTTLSPSSSCTKISADETTNLPTSTTKLRDPNAGGSTADNRFLIAGSASGVIALMIVVSVMMVIIRRTCKRKRTAREREGPPRTDEDGHHEMHTYTDARSIRNTCTDDRPQRSIDTIPIAEYSNVHKSPEFVSDGLEYEFLPYDESKAFGRKQEIIETLNSSVYCSLVPNVYGSLQVPHETHEDDADGHVACASHNNENTYQQLNTFGQQSHGEYQALKYDRG